MFFLEIFIKKKPGKKCHSPSVPLLFDGLLFVRGKRRLVEAMNIYSKTILFLQRYDCQSLTFEQGKISYILGLKKKKANQQKYMTYSKGSTIYSFLIEKIN